MEPTTLQLVWFGLVGVLMAGYAILDGFDLGVGILHLFARNDTERRVFMNSIGQQKGQCRSDDRSHPGVQRPLVSSEKHGPREAQDGARQKQDRPDDVNRDVDHAGRHRAVALDTVQHVFR